MVFQPQKPQGSMLDFGDIHLSTLASLSPFSLTSIIALGYKNNLFSPLFSSSHLTSAGAKTRLLYPPRRASCWGGKGEAGTRPAANCGAAASPHPPAAALCSLCGSRSAVNTSRQEILEGKQRAACWSCWSLLKKKNANKTTPTITPKLPELSSVMVLRCY